MPVPALLRDRVGRFITLTAVVGSLADWTLFAALVAVVDTRTEGSAWATTAVLLARLLPALAFAPLAARRIDRRPLRGVLPAHEIGRVAAIGALALFAVTGPVIVIIATLVALEFAAAILASGRESLISRHIGSQLHPAVNTATVVASYGLLPVGALLVQFVGASQAIPVAAGLQALVLLAYLVAWPVRSVAVEDTNVIAIDSAGNADETAAAEDRGLRRTVLAAAVGLAPVVALFTVAPRLSQAWLGDSTATGIPMGLLLVGGIGGLVLANKKVRAEFGLLAAGIGFVLAAVGLWQVGVPIVGLGAGLAYLSLQTRLQSQAQDPSQFAAAFAVLKVATVVGTVAGPLLWSVGDGPVVLLLAASGVAVAATAIATDPRPALQWVMRRLVLAVARVEVVGQRHEGGAVVISNHPNAIDGVLALAVDPTLRPIARWQSNLLARAGIWLADSVVTTARTDKPHAKAFEQAAKHLAAGGRIWLAPEGGCHQDATLRAPRTGAVRMAAMAGVPVQVLGIRHHGAPNGPSLWAWRPWIRPAATLVWGEVVEVTGDVGRDVDATMAALGTAAGMAWAPQRRAVAA